MCGQNEVGIDAFHLVYDLLIGLLHYRATWLLPLVKKNTWIVVANHVPAMSPYPLVHLNLRAIFPTKIMIQTVLYTK